MTQEDELIHYGILRKSGRYPWGSGQGSGTAYSRSLKFYQVMDEFKRQGISEADTAKAVGLSVAQLRATLTIAKGEKVAEETNRAVTLRDKGVSPTEIARKLDMPLATVRLRLKNSENQKASALRQTADTIRENVDKYKIVDIGKGVDVGMGISPERLKAAVAVLHDEGYESYKLQQRQPGGQHFTNRLVLVPPGTGFGPAKKMINETHIMTAYSEDNGMSYTGGLPYKPISINSKRLKVNFAEDGGTDADGVIYVRPGVKDLDMGKNTYAQVRIMVDDTHYLKGMAIKKDDLPAGVDLVFNTNKSRSVGKLGALKEKKDDPENPFGSQIKRQITGIDPKTGKEGVISALNLVNEEGDWDVWRKSIPSQVLAKQPHSLIKSQLEETRKQTQTRIDEINKITNAVVRKKALEDYAEQIDADAVDLRAAQMPKQRTQVIIPLPKMNKTEIYAPNFETGERVVLVRFPHAGRFEIPEVTVNNNNRTAKKLLGNAKDAIGIHPTVAEKLSGADFDGDTVVVFPNRSGKIKGSQSLGSSAKVFEEGLKSFDPKRKYGPPEDGSPPPFKIMKNTGKEMGMITNLITDMSIQGAKPEHVVRAVRHSMVVIDAEKHKLDYQQSALDNNISQLKSLYQHGPKSGATTLLSQATAIQRVNERQLRSAKNGGPIDPKTGALVYEETGKTRSKYDAKTQTYSDEKVAKQSVVKRLALTDNAFDLVRDPGDPVEKLYAEHANGMKYLANQTRLAAVKIPNPLQNKAAKNVYRDEIADLNNQLREVIKQKPLDRQAQSISNKLFLLKRQEDPTLKFDRDRREKIERSTLAGVRARMGLKKPEITITDTQWDAIQAGAVSATKLRAILENADPKRVSELSMPRQNTVVTKAVASRAKALLASGVTNADAAAALGISVSTLKSAISRGDV